MISSSLVQLVEDHWEMIANRVIAKIRLHPDLPTLAKAPEGELKEWCREILQNFGYWLVSPKGEELKRRYEVMGRLRFEESIPLHEAVLRIHILKGKIFDYIHQQGFTATTVHLYAREELVQRVSSFFDCMVYYIVRGYEHAQRRAALLAA